MRYRTDRREFLKESLFAAAALTASSLSSTTVLGAATPRRVVVIGAGLAGLAAAYELTQAGHDVIVIEAQSRPGGRAYTIRQPFADGLHVEAGAVLVTERDEFTNRYLKLFNIPLVELAKNALAEPAQPRNPGSFYFARGKRVKVSEGEKIDWPFNLTADERKLGLSGMEEKYVVPAANETDPSGADWPPESLKKYDKMSYADFLGSQGASPGAVDLLKMNYLSMNGDGINSVSALYLLREAARTRTVKQWNTIQDGSDSLPRAFAARLKEKIHYGAPAVRIEQSAQGAKVSFLEAGAPQVIAADYVVCAIPFSVFRHPETRIEVSPSFSPEKRRVIEELPYTSLTRVYLQFRERFWDSEGLGLIADTDLPIGFIINDTYNQPGSRGILESYTCGPQARSVGVMSESERISFTLRYMEKVFPNIRDYFEGSAYKCWDEDKWARGAKSYYKPGQMTSLLPYTGRSEGRVHFAGEHTSPRFSASMNGAIESGIRVAQEINESQ